MQFILPSHNGQVKVISERLDGRYNFSDELCYCHCFVMGHNYNINGNGFNGGRERNTAREVCLYLVRISCAYKVVLM